MTVQHNPDDVISVLNDFFDAMMQIVYEQEGVVFDITGDELMVGFNVPFNQPDAPYRALSTAIAMQQHFAHLQLLWANRGIQVGMGIGMNRGPVVLGHIGGRSRMNYAMVGQSVNVAHRLVEMAKDGEIVMPPDVLADALPAPDWLAGIEGLSVATLPPQPIRGVTTPLPVTRLKLSRTMAFSTSLEE